ncbi:MAG: hypothetical protein JO033_14110 [Acidobacteriaceae bacterium]|nr:hypothetical protein [Acidobacteriaceae bacterium]MBV9503362.1 hypothetical protein [Acidobacteriaceae bacterium]
MKTTANEHEEELRDRFAAAALAALLSQVHPSTAFATRPDKEAEDVAHDKLATEAYRWADAMLKARNRS